MNLKNKHMRQLTEKELWRLIEDATWKVDHDYNRIGDEWSNLDKDIFDQLEEFARRKQSELADKFEDAWLGNDGGDGISVSDDSWSDLTADVVGRGEEFYNAVTADMLRDMADDHDYEENFMYSFHFNDDDDFKTKNEAPYGEEDESDWIPSKIEIGVYYFVVNGEPVIDVEEMQREFEEKLKELGVKL